MSLRSIIQMGLVALVLFAVSAALSVWLNQSKTPETDGKDRESAKSAAPKDEKPAEKAAQPKAKEKDEKSGPEAPAVGAVADVRAREERLERRQAQMDLVLRDLQTERDAVDNLTRRVTEASRDAAAAAREAAANPPAAKLPDPNTADPAAIKRMAAMYDNMTPESAALILKQMADSGKLDTAVRILAEMQPRAASRVLAEIEPTLAAQLLEKMRTLKRTTPATTPGAAAPAAPAGVTSNVPAAVVPPRPLTP